MSQKVREVCDKYCKMFEMRVNGATYQEIADYFHVTKQYVHSTLSQFVGEGYTVGTVKCVYPGLKRWMLTTGTSAKEINKKLQMCSHPSMFYNRIRGKTQFTIQEVKKILAFTGLTFEEAFGEEDIPGGDSDGCEQQAEGREI